MEKTKLNIFGASGHSKVIIDILKSREIEIDAIYDDDKSILEISGYKVLHTSNIDNFVNPFVIAVGNNKIRYEISRKLNLFSNPLTHSSAIISKSAKISSGTVIMANAVVNADTIVGEHCILNSGCVVEHDCILKNFVHISPNASIAGGVKIEEGTHIGIGASVIPNVKIGKWVTVGAGSVIIENIPDYAVVVGNPGRIIKVNKPL